jgi:hypothetical protein
MGRRLFKTMELDVTKPGRISKIEKLAQELACKHVPGCDEKTKHLYVRIDDPTRISYRQYDWSSEAPDESIWISDGAKSWPLEQHPGSQIIDALKRTAYFPRLIFTPEIRTPLLDAAKVIA